METITAETLGKLLQAARQSANLTQAELAQRLGFGRTAVKNYEAGRRTPDLLVAIKIAKALNMTLDEILMPIMPGRYTKLKGCAYFNPKTNQKISELLNALQTEIEKGQIA